MSKILVMIFLCIALISPDNYAQVEFSDPKSVGKAFLDSCLAGKRFVAVQEYATENSSNEIEILIKQMVTKDIPLVNKDCTYIIDSCEIDEQNNIAKCFYRKSCKDDKNKKSGYLTLKKIDDEWRVEYLWKRDKYL